MVDIKKLRISKTKHRLVIIKDITTKTIKTPKGDFAEKLVFVTEELAQGRTFQMSDAWVTDINGRKAVSGIWLSLFNGQISPDSTLAKLLTYYEVENVGDLMDKTVKAHPDKRGYLVLMACEIDT